jgi:hypothetical protein
VFLQGADFPSARLWGYHDKFRNQDQIELTMKWFTRVFNVNWREGAQLTLHKKRRAS